MSRQADHNPVKPSDGPACSRLTGGGDCARCRMGGSSSCAIGRSGRMAGRRRLFTEDDFAAIIENFHAPQAHPARSGKSPNWTIRGTRASDAFLKPTRNGTGECDALPWVDLTLRAPESISMFQTSKSSSSNASLRARGLRFPGRSFVGN